MPTEGYILIILSSPTSYLLGSVSTAIVVCKLLGYEDPRSQGSNNPGATNVLRIAGKKAALITLAGDAIKGVIPILITAFIIKNVFNGLFSNAQIGDILGCCGLSACLGHLFPIYFKFEGGKGMATSLGVALTWSWPAGLSIIATWLFIAATTRYSSFAALISWLFAPIYVGLIQPEYLVYTLLLSCLVIYRHKENIKRLLNGAENKIGSKSG